MGTRTFAEHSSATCSHDIEHLLRALRRGWPNEVEVMWLPRHDRRMSEAELLQRYPELVRLAVEPQRAA